MDLQELEQTLDRLGADVEEWPDALQAAARALLTESQEARGLLEQAQRVASLLDELPAMRASGDLQRRLAEIPLRHPRESEAWVWPFETLWRPLLGLALAAVFGVLVGSAAPTEVADGVTAEEEEWNDIAAVLLGDTLDTLDEEGEET
jgi:hypothetical protein